MILRMTIVVVMLWLSAWTVRTAGHGEPVALRRPFSEFPASIGEWEGRPVRFEQRIEEKLGVTDYVSNLYLQRPRQYAHLYVGYYSSQRHGEMIHSPKNCLPGNGWYIASRGTAVVDVAPFPPFEVNSFVVENGTERQAVLYWYQQSGGRIVTNEYLGRVHLVFDAISRHRTDAALIRVAVPIEREPAEGVRNGLDFLKAAYPTIMRFLPHDAQSQS